MAFFLVMDGAWNGGQSPESLWPRDCGVGGGVGESL